MVVARFDFWAAFGVLAQFVFGARFLVQWIASEKAEKSVIPVGFWFLSIGGGLMTLIYGFARRDLVIILGQAFSIFIYVRNLMLIAKEAQTAKAKDAAGTPPCRWRLEHEPAPVSAAQASASRSRAKPASRSALRSSRSSSPIWKRKAGPPGFHWVAVR